MNGHRPNTPRLLPELLWLGGCSFHWQVFEHPETRVLAVVGVRRWSSRVADVFVLGEREVHAYRTPVTPAHPDPLRPTAVWRWLSSQDPVATLQDLLDLPTPTQGHLIAPPAPTGVPAGMRSAYRISSAPLPELVALTRNSCEVISDIRAQQAREHHERASAASAETERHREQRNRLVRALRDTDPHRWTCPALAGAVGCSPELIAAIVKGRT